MDIPPQEDHIWNDIVCEKRQFAFECLSVKILQGTLARSIAKDPSPVNIDRCARTLRELFAENAAHPSIQKDLEKICKS